MPRAEPTPREKRMAAATCAAVVAWLLAPVAGRAAGARLELDRAVSIAILLAWTLLQLVLVGASLVRARRWAIAPPEPASGPRRSPTDRGPRLAPLRCPACGAPQPLRSDAAPCVHCRATVPAPPDVQATLTRRAAAAEQLARAERLVRAALRLTSLPVVAGAALLALLWSALPAAVIGAASESPREGVFAAALGAGMLGSAALLVVTVSLLLARDDLPPLPARAKPFEGPEADAACAHCTAPLHFRAADFSALCTYCGAETLRLRFAREARRGAETAATHAAASVREAGAALATRRDATARAYFIGTFVLLAIGAWTALLDVSILLSLVAASVLAMVPVWALRMNASPARPRGG